MSVYFFRFFKRLRSSFMDKVDSFRRSSMSFQNPDNVCSATSLLSCKSRALTIFKTYPQPRSGSRTAGSI